MLDAARVRGHALSDALRDITWASTGKTASAQIEGLHWQDGYMAVEVREATRRRFERDLDQVQIQEILQARPRRRGWLWGGVTPSEDAPGPSGGAP